MQMAEEWGLWATPESMRVDVGSGTWLGRENQSTVSGTFWAAFCSNPAPLCSLNSLDCAVIFLCSTQEERLPRKGLLCIAHMRKAITMWPFQEALGFYTQYFRCISIFSN